MLLTCSAEKLCAQFFCEKTQIHLLDRLVQTVGIVVDVAAAWLPIPCWLQRKPHGTSQHVGTWVAFPGSYHGGSGVPIDASPLQDDAWGSCRKTWTYSADVGWLQQIAASLHGQRTEDEQGYEWLASGYYWDPKCC